MTATLTEPAPTVTPPTLQATAPAGELVDALRFVTGAVVRRPLLPILRGVRLDAREGALKLTMYDYETAASTSILAPGARARAVVPARALLDMVRALPRAAAVTLTADTTGDTPRIVVTGAGVRYTLAALPLDDFPAIGTATPGRPLFTLTRDQLGELAAVGLAAGRDAYLPILTGVRVERNADTGKLTAAATDRYRLIVDELDVDAARLDAPALIPEAMLRYASRTLKASQIAVRPHTSHGPAGLSTSRILEHITLEEVGGTRHITTRVIDGEFPRFRQLLPETVAATVVVDRQELDDACRRLAVVARHSPLKAHITASGIALELSSAVDASGETSIGAELKGDPLTLGLNPLYVRDALAALGGDKVTVGLTGEHKPVTFTRADRPGFTYLLMPVRLGW